MKRIHNALLLAPDCMTAAPGELWIDDAGRIALCGAPKAPAPAFDEQIDARGGLVLPGFKNAHSHSAMTFLRSRADDLPLWEWLSGQIFPREACLCAEDVYWLTKLAILEYVSGGITACFDMYFHIDAFVQACVECGFRAVLCGSAMARDADGLDALCALYDKYHAYENPLISAQLGFHAEYTADETLLLGIAKLARAHKAPVFMHNSETRAEVEGCLARHGKTPTELFCETGIYDFGGGGFHCVWLSERDISLFAEKGLFAVTCPGSNAKLASGIAPLCELDAAGVPFGIGTDGAASNNGLDFFWEMRLCTALQKLTREDAAALPAERVLRAAVSDGARAMGLSDCDSLAPGKCADLCIIDLHTPSMQPVNRPVQNLVYAGSKQTVMLTMVAGRTLYRDGAYCIGEAPEAIYRQAARITERIEAQAK